MVDGRRERACRGIDVDNQLIVRGGCFDGVIIRVEIPAVFQSVHREIGNAVFLGGQERDCVDSGEGHTRNPEVEHRRYASRVSGFLVSHETVVHHVGHIPDHRGLGVILGVECDVEVLAPFILGCVYGRDIISVNGLYAL